METGAFTGDIDLIQVLLVGFAIFFGGLVFYLRREDKREGYPLEPTTSGRAYAVVGWPAPPPPKTYRLQTGGTARMPHRVPQIPLEGVPPPAMGSGYRERSPLTAGLGAAAWVMRRDEPMQSIDGDLLLKPLRLAPDWRIIRGDVDPRGRIVLGRDFRKAGIVTDLWVDRAARLMRYLEVELDRGGTVLVPIFHCDVPRRDHAVIVGSLKAATLADVPRLADPDRMTAREEDRINAFHAGGTIYDA